MLNGSGKDPRRERIRSRGFICRRDDVTKTWKLVGSRSGLLRFRDLLLAYVADPRMDQISEHKHFGVLEIMTWTTAGFDHHAIHGSLLDLRRLASLVDTKLANARPGETISIQKEFASDSLYSLALEVRDDEFDPSRAYPLSGETSGLTES
jgi:hypothetical protein